MAKPVIALRDVTMSFQSVTALRNISIEAHVGKVLALLGDNGAGKSTLIKMLSGVYRPTSGSVEVDGRPVTLQSAHDARAAGISTVFQDLAVCDLMSIARNMVLGNEPVKRFGPLRSGPVDAIELCRQVLDGIDILNRRWRTDPVKNHPLMDLPNQIIVTQIKAGEHPSSTAGRGEIVIDVQYVPHEKDEFGLSGHVKREVEARLAAVCQADPYLRKHPVRVGWILDADCAEVAADHPFVAAFQGAAARAGLDPRLSGFGAPRDIGLPTGLGRTPTVNFGPGDPAQAHQPNERVSISDLVACTKAIALAIESWCRAAT